MKLTPPQSPPELYIARGQAKVDITETEEKARGLYRNVQTLLTALEYGLASFKPIALNLVNLLEVRVALEKTLTEIANLPRWWQRIELDTTVDHHGLPTELDSVLKKLSDTVYERFRNAGVKLNPPPSDGWEKLYQYWKDADSYGC